MAPATAMAGVTVGWMGSPSMFALGVTVPLYVELDIAVALAPMTTPDTVETPEAILLVDVELSVLDDPLLTLAEELSGALVVTAEDALDSDCDPACDPVCDGDDGGLELGGGVVEGGG